MRYLLASLLLLSTASAADFGRLTIEHGYQGPLVVDVEWSPGTVRDVSAATATLTVYSVAPVKGAGGTVLFACDLTPVGDPVNRLACNLTAANTATPGTYYAVVSVTEGSTVDPAHGTVELAGR